MGPPDPGTGVFDSSHYAAGWWRKVQRSFQLGPRYYLWDLPRYWKRRRMLHLPGWDLAAFFTPLREFHARTPGQWPLPPAYTQVLQSLREAGVRVALPRARLEALLGVWWSTRSVPGDAIECGSYRGATALTLALLGQIHQISQRILLLDTFSGTPETCPYDISRPQGEFVPPADQVDVIRQQAQALGILDRIEIHQGLFAESFARLEARDLRFAFVHIDANLYQGTREACLFTLPRMHPGGALVFDDYNGPCDLGPRLAIDQSLMGTGLKLQPLVWSSAYVRVEGKAP